jgi:hypothetical protein
MQETKIPFGERDGILYRALEVENGHACGCYCPGCGEPLNAANGGLKVIPHFRHVASVDCVSGYKEGVRRAAVALIAAQKRLALPDYSKRITASTDLGIPLHRDLAFPVAEAEAETVERFVDLGGVIAHAVLTNGNRRLLVRIRVTSRAESKRRELLKVIDASSIEIDLSGLSLAQINDPVSFQHAVLKDHFTRSWIRSLRAEMRSKLLEGELALEVARCNLQWKEEQKRLQEVESSVRADQEAREADHAAALLAHRQAQAEAAEAQRIAEADGVENDPSDLQRRKELIVNQWLRAAREWGFKAAQCDTCWLLSPPGTEFCPFCASDKRTMPEVVPQDIESTYHHRIRCSIRAENSLRDAPMLVVQPS